ncbi:VWA domain-containing protein [Virgibacillus sp. C22-A2]|uniref:VWA domain-containing protein n=1 Tax=Virgibacillus tibetensis TaxID=3042313 RepID=A0ABU6KF29_9BACI|nr:VWA domain-containing protein [Virgibacillus sp. C22-A2]
MKKIILLISLAILLTLVIAGCKDSKGETEPEEDTSEQQEEQVNEEEDEVAAEDTTATETIEVEPAKSIEEILAQESGEFSVLEFDEEAVWGKLDEMDFQDQSADQIFNSFLGLMSQSETYKEYDQFIKEFNASIEAVLSDQPEGMELKDGQEMDGTANISILLDASGSMAQQIGGKTKMDLAKKAIDDFVASMPEESNIALRVYGHKGSNQKKDKELSCDSTEMVYPLQPYHESDFNKAMDSVKSTGYTPLAKAISESKKDFEQAGNTDHNIIYVVSDGIETCGGDPAKEAETLHQSNMEAVVNIIGFDVDSEGQQQLMEAAEAGGGNYETVNSAKDFEKVWERERVRLFNEWSSWRADNFNEVSSEQSDKLNELYGKRTDFMNLTFKEEGRLKDAALYLVRQEQIDSQMRGELFDLISERQDILEGMKDDFNELVDKAKEAGNKLKEQIQEKGKDMQDKYSK